MIYANGASHPALKNPYISTLAYDNNSGAGGSRIALIFDDGYRSNFLEAAPVLAKYGFAATLAIETDRVGQNYGGEENLPVCTAADMRSLIEEYKWEICNHPLLDDEDTEENIVAAAREENTNLVALLTGERVWNGSSFVSGSLDYPEFADYKVTSAVYRGGVRNSTTDKAFTYLYDRVRVINGTEEDSGDRLYGIDRNGRYEQIVSAFPADTEGDETVLMRLLAFVSSVASTGNMGIIYAHDTPTSDAGSSVSGDPPPYIHVDHLEQLCRSAHSAGVQIVPWYGLGRSNVCHDSSFEFDSAYTFAAASGDSAEYDEDTTLNGGDRSVVLTCATNQGNLSSTSVSTSQFNVSPFCRYRISVRYRIDTDITRFGGVGNINHGLACLLTTYQSNTIGNTGGQIDDWDANVNTSGYERPYESTPGWETMEVELYTGYGTTAALTLGLYQCTGTAYIGHISITRVESIVRSPLSGDLTYNTSIGRNVFLMTPPTSPVEIWQWEFRVQDSARTFDVESDETVDYAFVDSANVPSPSTDDTCYVLSGGAGDFTGEGGKIGTYDGASWSFASVSDNTFIKAGNGEGILDQYYVHHKTSTEGSGIFSRSHIGVYHDGPCVIKNASNWFSVYNQSGTRTDSFTWVARPRWVKE